LKFNNTKHQLNGVRNMCPDYRKNEMVHAIFWVISRQIVMDKGITKNDNVMDRLVIVGVYIQRLVKKFKAPGRM